MRDNLIEHYGETAVEKAGRAFNRKIKLTRGRLMPGMEFDMKISIGKESFIEKKCRIVGIYQHFVCVEHTTAYGNQYRICYPYQDFIEEVLKKEETA